jgi:hypothetical protein
MFRHKFLFFFMLLVLVIPFPAYAADGGRLRLSASKGNLAVGQEMTVDVLVENAPTIYGADVQVVFDPAYLEVVDADSKTAGIQVTPGSFLDIQKSFVLQHAADNQKGTVDYALALLNPAPAVQGKGTLVQIKFRTIAQGQTTITIQEGLFGTQAGETIAPKKDEIKVKIKPAGSGGPLSSIIEPIQQWAEESETAQATQTLPAAAWLLIPIGLGGVGLLAKGVWHRIVRKQMS